jgi:hypothetical protein
VVRRNQAATTTVPGSKNRFESSCVIVDPITPGSKLLDVVNVCVEWRRRPDKALLMDRQQQEALKFGFPELIN